MASPSPVDPSAAFGWLERLVDQPSWSLASDDLAACEALVAELFGTLADDVRTIDLPPLAEVADDGTVHERQLGRAVVASARPGIERRALLVGHYDTVFPPGSPFRGITEDGHVWRGPGIVDAKGGLVVAWSALATAERAGMRVGWDVVVVPDEEIGSPGSAGLLTEFAREASLGLGYEPSMPDGSLAAARPGSANFVHVIRGRAAHAGRELSEGRNAVLAAAALAQRIDGLNGDPELIANPGVLRGGSATNVVPDLAVLRSNVRATTSEAFGRMEASLGVAIEAIAVDGIEIVAHGGITRPPKPMHPAYRDLLEAVHVAGAIVGLDVRWQDTGGVCDGNVLAGAGLVNVDNLGPVGGDLHRSTEYLVPGSIEERARLSAEVLRRFDAGELAP